MYRMSLVPRRVVLAVLLTGLTLCIAQAAMPVAHDGPLQAVAPATAEAASRHWWGVKFNWTETNQIASWSASGARRILMRGGLSGVVVYAMYIHYREAARWSRFQGRCLGVTWVGSAAPGQRC
jgi:hypothetical protein